MPIWDRKWVELTQDSPWQWQRSWPATVFGKQKHAEVGIAGPLVDTSAFSLHEAEITQAQCSSTVRASGENSENSLHPSLLLFP